MFIPAQAAAMQQLGEFLPRAGQAYTSNRNDDYGPDRRDNVSQLSPWLRTRLLPEWTVLSAVYNGSKLGLRPIGMAQF